MTISKFRLGLSNLHSAPGKNSRSRVGHTVAFMAKPLEEHSDEEL